MDLRYIWNWYSHTHAWFHLLTAIWKINSANFSLGLFGKNSTSSIKQEWLAHPQFARNNYLQKESFVLNLILQSEMTDWKFEIYSKTHQWQRVQSAKCKSKQYFTSKIKGNIPLFRSSSMGYILQFYDVKERKYQWKPEMTEKKGIRKLS